MSLSFLPTLNAMLNATCGILLISGYVMIRRRNVNAHRAFMIAALVAAAAFLTSYIIYHFNTQLVTRFRGEGIVRTVYFIILISHTILATVIVPFVLMTVIRAARGQFEKHRRIARWTFPMWLYVSVTGVIVYLMLYHLYPS